LYSEEYKSNVMAEEFRQDIFKWTSADALDFDESKRPTDEPVNESFRKLTVD